MIRARQRPRERFFAALRMTPGEQGSVRGRKSFDAFADALLLRMTPNEQQDTGRARLRMTPEWKDPSPAAQDDTAGTITNH